MAGKKKLDVTQLRRSELIKLAVEKKKVKKSDDHSQLTKQKLLKLLT